MESDDEGINVEFKFGTFPQRLVFYWAKLKVDENPLFHFIANIESLSAADPAFENFAELFPNVRLLEEINARVQSGSYPNYKSFMDDINALVNSINSILPVSSTSAISLIPQEIKYEIKKFKPQLKEIDGGNVYKRYRNSLTQQARYYYLMPKGIFQLQEPLSPYGTNTIAQKYIPSKIWDE